MVETQLFRRSDDMKALEAIEKGMLGAGYDAAEVSNIMNKLRRRPLLRWIVLKSLREEIEGADLVQPNGQIDWDAIGDFIIKVAPIIMEIVKMLIGLM